MKSMLYNSKSYNIVGGGLIGLQIALRLSTDIRFTSRNTHINLYDQSDDILSAWDSKSCGVHRVNNGFHGIELPRSLTIQAFLEDCKCKDLLIKIPNIRSLNIEGECIAFDTCLSDWPNGLSEGLASLKHANTGDASQDSIINQTISSTKLGQLISIASDRFADKIDDSWHLFFPWFFPSDFKFPPGDEGNNFQNEVRSKQKKSYYLIPKTSVFEDLKNSIRNSLQARNIKFLFNQELSLDTIKELSAFSGDQLIWCASSFSLLRALNPDLAKRCISSKRHMHLMSLAINSSDLHRIRNKDGSLPTEILCLDTTAPELNRISFLNYTVANSPDPNKSCILLAEYFTKSIDTDNEICDRIAACLKKLFDSDLSIDGHSYSRPIYTLNPQLLTEATSLIENYSSNNCIDIPEIYYGPINMSKCGKISQLYFS